MQVQSISEFLQKKTDEGVRILTEQDGYELMAGTSIQLPRRKFIPSSQWQDWEWIDWEVDELILKIVSKNILHKSEWGGVVSLPASREAVQEVMINMVERVGETAWDGFLLMEKVEFDKTMGNEWLLCFQSTPDFGPVVILAPGGIYAEYLSKTLESRRFVSVFSKKVHPDLNAIKTEIEHNALFPMVNGSLRNQDAILDVVTMAKAVSDLLNRGEELMSAGLRELEINPLVISRGNMVALDALVKIDIPEKTTLPARPLQKIGALLKPRTIGLIGVSEKMNPGKIILLNMLKCGFNRENITIVKPGVNELEGCRCVACVDCMPERVDLMVLSINAKQVPTVLKDLIRFQMAESIILIPGGLEEKAGTSLMVSKLKAELHKSRAQSWKGPVINGGNCVGIRSIPGNYDTLFIPNYKFSDYTGPVVPMALISQSGAYLVALLDRLAAISPRYSISLGNQTDLTVADYLTYLKDDDEIRSFSVYCEGLKQGDGERLLEAAMELKQQGKPVIFYHAGKTPEGASATASHTASVAGDHIVFTALARQAGILVADSLELFEDLTFMVQCFLDHPLKGMKLGALSNAGFECVAIADQLGEFTLTEFERKTIERVEAQFLKYRLGDIVDIHNPLDLTPIMNDKGFVRIMEAVLDDPNVDVGVFGMVPLTPALQTLPPSEQHSESIFHEDSIVQQTLALWKRSTKPFVLVVDGGEGYADMVETLKKGGIPVFTKMDRALITLNALFHP